MAAAEQRWWAFSMSIFPCPRPTWLVIVRLPFSPSPQICPVQAGPVQWGTYRPAEDCALEPVLLARHGMDGRVQHGMDGTVRAV